MDGCNQEYRTRLLGAIMHRVILQLDIPREECLRYYRGEALQVHARSEDGRWIRFPARVLRPHIAHDGVRGRFELLFDARNHLVNFRRIE